MQFALGAGSLFGFLAVALGAFGAHALKSRLSPDMLAVYETAVTYQMYHALALLATGAIMLQFKEQAALVWAARLFTIGIIVFSGSLYVLSLSGVRWLGAITPIGGVALLCAWATLAVAVLRSSAP